MRDQNPVSGISASRLDELLNSINVARDSLTRWQDKRTEALINLDSFTYDIKMIEEEKKRSATELQDLRNELQAQIRIYQSHVNELTDQMQLLKLENEGYRNEILAKDLLIENHLKEIESQERLRDQIQNQHLAREAEIQSEIETRAAQKIWDLEMKNEAMNLKVQDANEKRNEAKIRSERLELELVQLRGQMMNALKVTPLAGDNYVEASSAQTVNLANESAAATAAKPNATKASSSKMTMEEVKKLRPMESDAGTVDEYLKRLGY